MTRMRVFWSVYCILLGIILLLKLLLRWDVSAWNIALALLFLESGLFLLTGGFGLHRHKHVTGGGLHTFFTGSIGLAPDAPQLTLLLSSATVDLTAPLSKLSRIRCVFSSVTIRIPEGYSVRTVCRGALSTIETPVENLRGFCDRVLLIGDGLQTQMEIQCLLSDVRILD